jgi:hypothetical protein
LSVIFVIAADGDNFADFIDIVDGWDWFHYYFIAV